MNEKETEVGESVVIYGAGGFGRGIAELARVCGKQVPCFIDDNEIKLGKVLNGIPVMALDDARRKHRSAPVVVAVNEPKLRELIIARVVEAGFSFTTLIHPRVDRSPWLEVGEGSVVREGCCFSVNVVLGRHVILNMACTIGHDAVLNDFVTLAPGVNVSGHVRLGRRVNIGTGVTTIHGTEDAPLVIGDDAVIGAGACVIRPVLPGVTVVGVPAKPIPRNDR